MASNTEFVSREGQTCIYQEIHDSILGYPGNTSEYHSKRLQLYPHEFDRIANAITKWPNTFWGMGPFKKTEDGWFIDYEKSPMKKLSCECENKLLRERIKVLEATVAQLNTDNGLLVEKLEKGYEKLKTVVNSSMNGWNSGSL